MRGILRNAVLLLGLAGLAAPAGAQNGQIYIDFDSHPCVTIPCQGVATMRVYAVYTKVCIGFPVTMCRNPEPPFPDNAQCSQGLPGFINPISACRAGCCPFAVEGTSWSEVKALYRTGAPPTPSR